MEFAIEWNLFEDLAAIGLEGSAEVVDIDAAEFGHHPVGDPGRNAAHPEIIDADFAPAADDVVPRGNFFEEERDVSGVVLQIAIHGDDVFAAGVVETCGQSGGLAEVPAKFNDCDPAVDCGDFAQHRKGVVARTIVDENDLEGLTCGLHDDLQAIVEIGDVFLLVMQRYDDGVFRHSVIDYNVNRCDAANSLEIADLY